MLDLIKQNIPNISLYKERIKKARLVSFDVFDTLIIRDILMPVDVFRLIEALTGHKGFSTKRQIAEKRLYGYDEPVTFKKIYASSDLKEYRHLAEKEKEIELLVMRAHPYGPELLRYALELGKEVIFISDMYFPAQFIRLLLKNVSLGGLTSDIPLFVSSETGKYKWDKTIFLSLAKEFGIKNLSEWVHIGDNWNSDYLVPKNLGIEALHLPNVHEIVYYQYLKKARVTPLFSIILGYAINEVYARGSDYLYTLVAGVLSPLYLKIIRWIINNRPKDTPLYFLSRDGYHLHSIFSRLLPSLESYYLPISRHYIALLYLSSFGSPRELVSFLRRKDPNFEGGDEILLDSKLMDIFKIPINEGKGVDLLGSVQHNWKSIRQSGKQQLKRYVGLLESLGFFKQRKVSIFDVGWNGTIQRYLLLFMSKISRFPKVFGFYLGLARTGLNLPISFVKACCYTLGHPIRVARVIQKYVAMFELFFSAPHGKFVGLDKEGKMIEAQEEENYIKFQDDLNEALHKAIGGFLQRYKNILLKKELDFLKEEALVNLFYFLHYPNLQDLKYFKNIRVEVGNSFRKRPLFSVFANIEEARKNIDKIKNSPWPDVFIIDDEEASFDKLRKRLSVVVEFNVRQWLSQNKRFWAVSFIEMGGFVVYSLVEALRHPIKALRFIKRKIFRR